LHSFLTGQRVVIVHPNANQSLRGIWHGVRPCTVCALQKLRLSLHHFRQRCTGNCQEQCYQYAAHTVRKRKPGNTAQDHLFWIETEWF